MTHKKNKFFTFCFSLIPGAGEMYMGFMKMGVSLMGLFIAIIFVGSSLGVEAIYFASIIVWFYSFFHVSNLASLPDDEFYAVEDDYIFHLTDQPHARVDFLKAYHKPISIGLIILGIILIWQSFNYVIYRIIENTDYYGSIYSIYRAISNSIPKLAAGTAIIVLGYMMIRGKKKEINAKMSMTMETEVKADDGNEHTKEHE